MGLTEQALREYCAKEGVSIRESARIPGLGHYDAKTRTIWLNNKLTARERTPVLLHEIIHHRAGHDGPQPPRIEARVKAAVARLLVNPTTYAKAEAITGGAARLIAEELDLPCWLTEDFRTLVIPTMRSQFS